MTHRPPMLVSVGGYSPDKGDSARELYAAWKKAVPERFDGAKGAQLAQLVLDDLTTTMTAIMASFAILPPLPPWPSGHAIRESRTRLRKIRDGFEVMKSAIIARDGGKFGPLLMREARTMYGYIDELQRAAMRSTTPGDLFKAVAAIGSWLPLVALVAVFFFLKDD